MKFEIRRVQNGAVLRIEPDYPDAETEEAVYQETETDDLEAFADFFRSKRRRRASLSICNK